LRGLFHVHLGAKSKLDVRDDAKFSMLGIRTSEITTQEHGAQLYPKPMANTQMRAHAAQPAATMHLVHGHL